MKHDANKKDFTQGIGDPLRESRRIKAYPHVPDDAAAEAAKAIEAWISLDRKLAWASWAFVATVCCLLLTCLVISLFEFL